MIRILVADDELLVRSGIRRILEAEADMSVVAEATNGEEAISAARRHPIDVALLDIRMPVMDGLTAAKELHQLPNPPKIAMLTTFDEDDHVVTALRSGAVGFLTKDTPPWILTSSVRAVAEGNAMLSPHLVKRLLGRFAAITPSQTELAREQLTLLTEREHEVILAVADGLSNAEISQRLSMAESTVKAHVSSTLAKLGLGNRVQAAILVHEARLTQVKAPS